MAAKKVPPKKSPTPKPNAWQRWLEKQPKAVQIAFTVAFFIVILIILICFFTASMRHF